MEIQLHTDFEPVSETHDVDGLASPTIQEFNDGYLGSEAKD